MWLYTAAEQGDVEWVKKCISDGANVNYQDEVSYHTEGSVVNEILFTCTKHIHFTSQYITFQYGYWSLQCNPCLWTLLNYIHVYSCMTIFLKVNLLFIVIFKFHLSQCALNLSLKSKYQLEPPNYWPH